jgi:hypothetical protein
LPGTSFAPWPRPPRSAPSAAPCGSTPADPVADSDAPDGPDSPVTTSDRLDGRQLNRATLARQLLLERADLPAIDAVEHLVELTSQAPLAHCVALWTRLESFDPVATGDAAPDWTIVPVSPSARRSRETSVCSALFSSAGGRSPHTASTRTATLTGRPASTTSRLKQGAQPRPATSTRSPASSRTSSGPRIATCTRPLMHGFGEAG